MRCHCPKCFDDGQLDQAKAQYRGIVVNAFENTADALDAVHFDAEALSANFKASADAEEALTRANRQRNVGDIGLRGGLFAEQNYQQAQLSLIQARATRYADTVGLIAVLGGGWWNSITTVKEITNESRIALLVMCDHCSCRVQPYCKRVSGWSLLHIGTSDLNHR
jgi:hypothetical protein